MGLLYHSGVGVRDGGEEGQFFCDLGVEVV